MRELRNPFRLRVAERIESDEVFLRLFAPAVLDLLPEDGLWDRLQIFQSAPGGGKTSLFRLFTPTSLLAVYASRGSDDFKDVYQRLERLGTVSEEGPRLLGVMLSCARNYASLEDLKIEPVVKDRLLFSLLDPRLALASLRAALS